MSKFDKENVIISSDDCFRWSRKMAERMNELFEKETLTAEEQEEYKLTMASMAMFDSMGHDLKTEQAPVQPARSYQGMN